MERAIVREKEIRSWFKKKGNWFDKQNE